MVLFITLSLISSTFPLAGDTTEYKYLLKYEPEEVVWQDFIFMTGAKLASRNIIDYNSFNEKLHPGYYREYYSNRYEYYISAELVESFQHHELYDYEYISFSTILKGGLEYYLKKNLFFVLSDIKTKYNYCDWINSNYSNKGIVNEFQIGAGIGKVIPIFNMDIAIEIQNKLLELGMLEKEYTYRKLNDIADMIGKRSKYNNPEVFWKELEKEITDYEGYAGERLGAAATVNINRIINENLNWSWTYNRLNNISLGHGVYCTSEATYYKKWKDYHKQPIFNREKGFQIKCYAGNRYFRENSNVVTNKIFLGGIFNLEYPLSSDLQFSLSTNSEFFMGDTIKWRKADLQTALNYKLFNNFYTGFSLKYNGLSHAFWKTSIVSNYIINYRLVFYADAGLTYSSKYYEYRDHIKIGFKYLIF